MTCTKPNYQVKAYCRGSSKRGMSGVRKRKKSRPAISETFNPKMRSKRLRKHGGLVRREDSKQRKKLKGLMK